MKTNYPKHYSSPTQIIQLLKNNRGMVITDEAKTERYLTNISYHRLSAYIFPFYQIPKTNLSQLHLLEHCKQSTEKTDS